MKDKPVSLIQPPKGYGDWLIELKSKIHHAQQPEKIASNTGQDCANFRRIYLPYRRA